MIEDLNNPDSILTFKVKIYKDNDFNSYLHYDADFIENDGSFGAGINSHNEEDIIDFFAEYLYNEAKQVLKDKNNES